MDILLQNRQPLTIKNIPETSQRRKKREEGRNGDPNMKEALNK